MTISNSEKENAKEQAKSYLEKSIYTLALLLGLDPNDTLTASSVDDLTAGIPSISISDERQDTFQSLFNQVQALKNISIG